MNYIACQSMLHVIEVAGPGRPRLGDRKQRTRSAQSGQRPVAAKLASPPLFRRLLSHQISGRGPLLAQAGHMPFPDPSSRQPEQQKKMHVDLHYVAELGKQAGRWVGSGRCKQDTFHYDSGLLAANDMTPSMMMSVWDPAA